MKKKLFKYFKILGISILCLMFSWVIFSNILTIIEKQIYKPPGQMVNIHDDNMHVYIKGSGDNTIVLLNGLGTVAPVLDFEPLIDQLSKNNKVVVVEPFGYGWSDETSQKRTVENIVNEIRAALKKVNITEPVVLMPHSISGIYCLYYANQYPNEIKGIVGIDPTFPKTLDYFNEEIPSISDYMDFLAPLGIIRLNTILTPQNFLPIAEKGVYTSKNLKQTKAISAWKMFNKTIINEVHTINENLAVTQEMYFPKYIPVLIFASKNDYNKNNTAFFKDQIKDISKSKLIELQGNHYLHWTQSQEISRQTNDFLSSLKFN